MKEYNGGEAVTSGMMHYDPITWDDLLTAIKMLESFKKPIPSLNYTEMIFFGITKRPISFDVIRDAALA